MSVRNCRHPFTGALYTLQPDGNIEIVDGEISGLFGPDGQWIRGTLRESDPQLCVWVANNPHLDEPVSSDSHLTTVNAEQRGNRE